MTTVAKLRDRLHKLEALAADQAGTPEGELAAEFARQTRERLLVFESTPHGADDPGAWFFREWELEVGGVRVKWSDSQVDEWTETHDLGGVKADVGPERVTLRGTVRKFKFR